MDVLAEALCAMKAKPYPEYVPMPVRTKYSLSHDGSGSNNQLATGMHTDHLREWCHIRDSVMVSFASILDIQQWLLPDQPWWVGVSPMLLSPFITCIPATIATCSWAHWAMTGVAEEKRLTAVYKTGHPIYLTGFLRSLYVPCEYTSGSQRVCNGRLKDLYQKAEKSVLEPKKWRSRWRWRLELLRRNGNEPSFLFPFYSI